MNKENKIDDLSLENFKGYFYKMVNIYYYIFDVIIKKGILSKNYMVIESYKVN